MLGAKTVVAVKGIIVRDDTILVLRRSSSEDVLPGYWDIPGGRVDAVSGPVPSLVREIDEETTLQVEVLGPVSTWDYRPRKRLRIIGITYTVRYLRGEVRLSDEHDEFQWIHPDEVDHLKMNENLRAEIKKYGAPGHDRKRRAVG